MYLIFTFSLGLEFNQPFIDCTIMISTFLLILNFKGETAYSAYNKWRNIGLTLKAASLKASTCPNDHLKNI